MGGDAVKTLTDSEIAWGYVVKYCLEGSKEHVLEGVRGETKAGHDEGHYGP